MQTANPPNKPPSTGVPTKPDDLPYLPGVNLNTALAGMMGDEQLLIRVLLKIRDTQQRFGEQFTAAQTGADPGAPERLAHTLKSNAGTIGASNIQAAAGKLEQACREGAPAEHIGQLLQATLDELGPLVAALQQIA